MAGSGAPTAAPSAERDEGAGAEAAPAPAGDEAPPPGWWLPAVTVVVVVAAVVRVVGLGDRPMHHDESLDAWFSWRVGNGETVQYDPVYHGPLRFYLTAGLFHVLGEGEATARLTAAAAGTVVVGLLASARRWLGDLGSVAAAALAAVSPSLVYFSRFGREDSLMVALELGLLVVAAAWLRRPARWHPAAALGLLALAFATKESTFIVLAVMGSYVLLLGARDARAARRTRTAAATAVVRTDPEAGAEDGVVGEAARPSIWRTLAEPGWRAWALGLAAFAFVFCALFSAGFTHPGGIVDGAVDGIDYWLSQQPVNRGGMPWPFYLVLLAGYEWPITVLAALGLAAALRARDRVLGLVAWTALGNLAVYSWASERFPWLVVHPLVPLVALAGFGVDRLWARRQVGSDWGTTPYLAGAGLVLVVLGTNTARVAFAEPSNPRQLLAAVQTSDQVPDVLGRIEAIEAAAPAGGSLRIVVDSSSSAAWPWAWYLRDLPVAYVDLAVDPAAAAGADVVLAMEANVERLTSPPEGWRAQGYDHRVWWVPAWDDAGPADWAWWVANRRTFSPTGSLRAVLLTRIGLPGAS